MRSLLKFAAAAVLLAGWGLAALSLHLVRTANGVQVFPKNQLSPVDTYVDVRAWSSDDEAKHPAFYARIKQLDRLQILDPAADPAPTAEAEASPAPNAPAVASNSNRTWRANDSRGFHR